jgi:hypothetical protein
MYGLVMLGIVVLQAAFSAWCARQIARARGMSTRRWTWWGIVIGPAAILMAWTFAGRGTGAPT